LQITLKNIFEPKLNGRIETEYVYQERDLFTNGYAIPAERTKPWGTAHAVLCAKNVVNEPFAVINADDYYGEHAFVAAATFLQNRCADDRYAIIGYDLPGTLSDYGTVNRGVCRVNDRGELEGITERINIARKEDNIIYVEDGQSPANTS
jgi:UTP-glucose-1-phosphate uridylyltransferase